LTVATFIDQADASGTRYSTTGDFTATIHWGDGNDSSGTVSYANGTYSVSGSHTYFDEGSYPVTVDVQDDGGSKLTGMGKTTIGVGDAPLTDTSTAPAPQPGAIEGSSTSTLVVASFTDGNPGNHSGDFTAVIHWGDTTSSAGAVSYAGGTYHVSGSHTYLDEGSYQVTVDLSDDGGRTLNFNDPATITQINVNDAQPTVGIVGPSAIAINTVYPLTLVFQEPGNDTTEFWTINWGDGDVQKVGGNAALVTHAYTDGPTFNTISATVTYDDGTFAAVNLVNGTSFIEVTVQAPLLSQVQGIKVLPGQNGNASIPGTGGLDVIQAILYRSQTDSGSGSLFVGTYDNNPNTAGQTADGGLLFRTGATTTSVVPNGFFDVHVAGASMDDTAVVTFSYPGDIDATPVVGFFVRGQGWQQIRSSSLVTDTFTVDPVTHKILMGEYQGQSYAGKILDPTTLLVVDKQAHTVTAFFDSTSNPLVTHLHGTVFSVAVPVSQSNTATVAPPVASLRPADLGTTANYVSNTQVTLVLNVSQTAQGTASQSTLSSPANRDDNEAEDDSAWPWLPKNGWPFGAPPKSQESAPSKPAEGEGKKADDTRDKNVRADLGDEFIEALDFLWGGGAEPDLAGVLAQDQPVSQITQEGTEAGPWVDLDMSGSVPAILMGVATLEEVRGKRDRKRPLLVV
jgi:hypothetical protein